MSDADPQTARGEDLTAEILAAVAPLVDGQPSAIVVEAMAGAMLAAVTVATSKSIDQQIMLDRLAWRFKRIADGMETENG